MSLPIVRHSSPVVVERMLLSWLSHKNSKGQFFFYNHNLEDCKDYMEEKFSRIHNVSTIERAFRKLREDKKVQFRDASLPHGKEKRWYVISSLK
jgi:predicted adenine nucleotide alpha hydrolase (AANH) superfamily ATPase|tara:strand:- start:60 stop:341 length:282 start_codon:yes stop_codon:yes gene_type:complete